MPKQLAVLVILLFTFQVGFTQDDIIPIPQKSPLEKIETHVGIIDISVQYSRPSTRGRKIFGGLVPYDKVWRTGANVNTRITFSSPVIIGDKELAAGAYSIFTKPGADEWEVFFHTEFNEYGEPDTMLDENIIASITVPVEKQNRMLETFSINFENMRNTGCTLVFAWDQVLIQVPINVPTSAIMNTSLEKTLKQTADAYAYAAWNYFDIDKDAESALEAINFALSLREKDGTFSEWLEKVDPKDWSTPWYHQIKSEMHAALGQYKEAIAAAKRSLEICDNVEDVNYYIKKNKENIAKWEN